MACTNDTQAPKNTLRNDTLISTNDSSEVVEMVVAEPPSKDVNEETKITHVSAGTVTDINGNVYKTVKIGGQIWMKENMRATHDRYGNSIPKGNEFSTTAPYRYDPYPGNSSDNVKKYGYFYNYQAAQIVCPQGWHLPSEDEFWTLIHYCIDRYCADDEPRTAVAKALCSTKTWKNDSWPDAINTNPELNNKSGFSALAAGTYQDRNINGAFDADVDCGSFGASTDFWSNSTRTRRVLRLGCANNNDYAITHADSDHGCSVRCIRD